MSETLLIASHNQGKLNEFKKILSGFNLTDAKAHGISSPIESGLTFVENALIKARHSAASAGLPTIADDSGLVVPALAGEPGIHSARYAGENATTEENIDKLLQRLARLGDNQRQAYFVCTLVYLQHANDPNPIICQGCWHGSVSKTVTGDSGFGYDPVFWVPTHDCSAAELPDTIKNSISHRGQALAKLATTFHQA